MFVREHDAITTVSWDFANQSPEYLFAGETPDNGVIHLSLGECRLRIRFPEGRTFERVIDYAQLSRYEVIDHYRYLMYVSAVIR